MTEPVYASTSPVRHGGDPASLEARFGAPRDGWLDLSTGINPLPYGLPAMPDDVLHRLPTAADLAACVHAARGGYGVTARADVVAAPGTQCLIQMVPALFPPAEVTVMSPTYGEHAPAWVAAGHLVVDAPSICAQAARPAPFAVVVNPNNPDGRTQSVDGLLAMADELHGRGGCLVVDEAFADVAPDLSVAPHAGRPGLIVLRSLGKFYGLAGVRLGFALCAPDVGETLRARLGPWAVSGPALWAGTLALNDQDWATATRARLKDDARRLDGLLTAAGFEVLGGTDLFRLAARADAGHVYEVLARAGIAVRPFDDRPTWLRFGLPGRDTDWARLDAALKGCYSA